MGIYDKVIITNPEIQHKYLKGKKAIITQVNTSVEDYAGYDKAMDGLPMYDLVALEDGEPIKELLWAYEVQLLTA